MNVRVRIHDHRDGVTAKVILTMLRRVVKQRLATGELTAAKITPVCHVGSRVFVQDSTVGEPGTAIVTLVLFRIAPLLFTVLHLRADNHQVGFHFRFCSVSATMAAMLSFRAEHVTAHVTIIRAFRVHLRMRSEHFARTESFPAVGAFIS